MIYVSLRSKGGAHWVDVGIIAESYKDGGHVNSAYFSLDRFTDFMRAVDDKAKYKDLNSSLLINNLIRMKKVK